MRRPARTRVAVSPLCPCTHCGSGDAETHRWAPGRWLCPWRKHPSPAARAFRAADEARNEASEARERIRALLSSPDAIDAVVRLFTDDAAPGGPVAAVMLSDRLAIIVASPQARAVATPAMLPPHFARNHGSEVRPC